MLLSVLLSLALPASALVVVDAGSTGTRFYGIDACARTAAPLARFDRPLAREGDGALAEMIAEVARSHPRLLTEEIRVVATGGMRRLDGDSEACARSCALKRDGIRAALAAYPNAALHVVSGIEEGRLSWLSVALITGRFDAAMLELGGSTLQLTYPKPGGLSSVTLPLGVNTVLQRVPACAVPVADVDACLSAVDALVPPDAPALTVVGVGGSFNHLSRELGLTNLSASADRVEAYARAQCAKTAEELARTLDRRFVPQACAQSAIQLSLIRRFDVADVRPVSLELGAAFDPALGEPARCGR